MLCVWVEGDPAPQGSKSVGRYGQMYDQSHRLGPWREVVAWTVKLAAGKSRFPGQVQVELHFSLRLWADLDKLCRGVFDALTESGVISDDKQVFTLAATKVMGKRAGQPYGVLILMKEMVV